MQNGNLTGTNITLAPTEPNLEVGDELFIDNIYIPYPVTKFDYRPINDITEDDVGFGAIRVAWPELQGSGQISFRLEDVPADALSDLEALFNKPKSKRWLSWRGRRYRADGFEFSYEPDKDVIGLYNFTVECTVQRPYRALPPVPGTSIWPIFQLKNIGAGVNDEILNVFVTWPYMVIFYTSGVAIWHMKNGVKVVHNSPVQYGLGIWQSQPAIGQNKPEYLIAFADLSGKLVVLWFDGDQFFRSPTVTNLTVGRTAYYDGQQLLIDTPSGVWAFNPILQVLSSFDTSLRLNPAYSPLFLSSTSKPNAVYDASDVLMAWPVYDDKIICVKNDGFYLYKATYNEDNSIEIDTQLKVLENDITIANYGFFGSIGFPTGYWYSKPPVIQTVTIGTETYQIKNRNAKIVSSFSNRPVSWNILIGIAFDGYAYFPYTDKMVFRVEPLL
jgi:hypothetical protein